jgi:hypothetical protein
MSITLSPIVVVQNTLPLSTSTSSTVTITTSFGGVDNFRVVDANGNPLSGAIVQAFLTTDYLAGRTGSGYVKGQATTSVDGRWLASFTLATKNSYTLLFQHTNLTSATYNIST